MPFKDATPGDIDAVMQQSHEAFLKYRKLSLKQRAVFMRLVAEGIEEAGNDLMEIAGKETNLPAARLKTEKTRTIFQWSSYAEACEKGDWLNCRIDTAIPGKVPPKPDLRKTMVPLGPVIVFGASNFPFAYSTAGGDTASAFAAGCTVVVKAHPAHAGTSEFMADIIRQALRKAGLDEQTFQHIHGVSFEVGKMLVEHHLTRAVGFTGSVSGGRALFDWANQRKIPIPVFAEMGSVNPVFIFPEKLKTETESLAKMLAASVTLGLGQFCTKPGLIIAPAGDALEIFKKELSGEIRKAEPGKMLHSGIARSFHQKRDLALKQEGVSTVCSVDGHEEGRAVVTEMKAKDFLENPLLHEEIFGPYSMVVECSSSGEMLSVANALQGQLTTSVMATEAELAAHNDLIEKLKDLCGRFICNGVPTGVDVSLSMHHGGPYPATTDSRFTAVGADAIRRFARPLCYQNWPDSQLPDELKDENPLGIWRTVNNQLTREPLH